MQHLMSIAVFTRSSIRGACGLALVIAGIGALSLACSTAATGTVHAAVNPRVAQGDAIFHKQCINCHNKQPGDTSPFGPPNLHGVFHNKDLNITPVDAQTIITNGKGNMPTFGKTLTKAEIQSVVAFLKTY
jgi:mono/diheme cytochrome c family protein